MKTITVQLKQMKDIRGKIQLYLIIDSDEDRVIINIGKKTYDRINQLLQNEQHRLQTNQMEK